jgi:hypothetical protein
MQKQLEDSRATIHCSKFGQLLTHKTKFQDVYTPEEQLTIDEAKCPFRWRIIFRVYIKGKSHKYGIKMFELCEAKSGYVYNLNVYTGAHPTNS